MPTNRLPENQSQPQSPQGELADLAAAHLWALPVEQRQEEAEEWAENPRFPLRLPNCQPDKNQLQTAGKLSGFLREVLQPERAESLLAKIRKGSSVPEDQQRMAFNVLTQTDWTS